MEMRPWKYGGPPDMKESERMKELMKRQKEQPEETPVQMTNCPAHTEAKKNQQICSETNLCKEKSRMKLPSNSQNCQDTFDYMNLKIPCM